MTLSIYLDTKKIHLHVTNKVTNYKVILHFIFFKKKIQVIYNGLNAGEMG